MATPYGDDQTTRRMIRIDKSLLRGLLGLVFGLLSLLLGLLGLLLAVLLGVIELLLAILGEVVGLLLADFGVFVGFLLAILLQVLCLLTHRVGVVGGVLLTFLNLWSEEVCDGLEDIACNAKLCAEEGEARCGEARSAVVVRSGLLVLV